MCIKFNTVIQVNLSVVLDSAIFECVTIKTINVVKQTLESKGDR